MCSELKNYENTFVNIKITEEEIIECEKTLIESEVTRFSMECGLTVEQARRGIANYILLMKKSDEEAHNKMRVLELIKTGNVFRHFKGGKYVILCTAKHTENLAELVIYAELCNKDKIYARPLEEFLSKVDKKKYPNETQTYRFEFTRTLDTW